MPQSDETANKHELALIRNVNLHINNTPRIKSFI